MIATHTAALDTLPHCHHHLTGDGLRSFGNSADRADDAQGSNPTSLWTSVVANALQNADPNSLTASSPFNLSFVMASGVCMGKSPAPDHA